MKKDIQKLADSDPMLAELLQFRRVFFWADWRMYREGRGAELAEKLIRKFHGGTLAIAIIMPVLVLCELRRLVDDLKSDGSYFTAVSAFLMVAYVVGGTIAIVATIKQKRKVEQIAKKYKKKGGAATDAREDA